jgi:4-hydroxybenzoate polyprenyltransferase
MSVGYSLRLKELPLVDVFMLAGLYTIRIVAGGEATGHKMSLWLLAFSSFLFLSLAFLKRVEEMMAAARIARGYVRPARRGYTTEDVPILGVFGVAAAFSAVLVLALFVQSETSGSLYASPALLWGIVPVMLLWLCRMWLSASRGYMHHDPIVYAARDWVSWTAGAVMLLVLMAAKSFTIFAG